MYLPLLLLLLNVFTRFAASIEGVTIARLREEFIGISSTSSGHSCQIRVENDHYTRLELDANTNILTDWVCSDATCTENCFIYRQLELSLIGEADAPYQLDLTSDASMLEQGGFRYLRILSTPRNLVLGETAVVETFSGEASDLVNIKKIVYHHTLSPLLTQECYEWDHGGVQSLLRCSCDDQTHRVHCSAYDGEHADQNCQNGGNATFPDYWYFLSHPHFCGPFDFPRQTQPGILVERSSVIAWQGSGKKIFDLAAGMCKTVEVKPDSIEMEIFLNPTCNGESFQMNHLFSFTEMMPVDSENREGLWSEKAISRERLGLRVGDISIEDAEPSTTVEYHMASFTPNFCPQFQSQILGSSVRCSDEGRAQIHVFNGEDCTGELLRTQTIAGSRCVASPSKSSGGIVIALQISVAILTVLLVVLGICFLVMFVVVVRSFLRAPPLKNVGAEYHRMEEDHTQEKT